MSNLRFDFHNQFTIGINSVSCNHCEKTYSIDNYNEQKMRKHLKKHEINSEIKYKREFIFNKFEEINLRNVIARYTYLYNIKVSAIDTDEFKWIVNNGYKYELTSNKKSIIKDVEEFGLYLNYLLLNKLKNIRFISISVDKWTSSNKKILFGITAHWIEHLNYELKCNNALLGVYNMSDFNYNSSSEIMENILRKCFNDFDIENKIVGITSNKGTDVLKAIRDYKEINLIEKWNPCIAHILNNCMKKAFSNNEIIDHFYKFIKFCKNLLYL